MGRKEKIAKAAEAAMNAELDSTASERIADVASKDLKPAAMGKGVEQLFEKKLSKEEKKALAEQKKAERDAKKKASKEESSEPGAEGEGGGEEGEEGADGGADASKPAKPKGKKGGEPSLPSAPGALDTCVCSGVLTSRKDSRDVKVENFSISVHGKQLFDDCTFELNYGRRYGLIGLNGSGKSTLLSVLAARMVEIPEHLDIWHLHEEAKPSDRTALESVIDVVRDEQIRLEKLEEMCARGLPSAPSIALDTHTPQPPRLRNLTAPIRTAPRNAPQDPRDAGRRLARARRHLREAREAGPRHV